MVFYRFNVNSKFFNLFSFWFIDVLLVLMFFDSVFSFLFIDCWKVFIVVWFLSVSIIGSLLLSNCFSLCCVDCVVVIWWFFGFILLGLSFRVLFIFCKMVFSLVLNCLSLVVYLGLCCSIVFFWIRFFINSKWRLVNKLGVFFLGWFW